MQVPLHYKAPKNKKINKVFKMKIGLKTMLLNVHKCF